ncbi:hypothetical protein V2A60_008711 [Cordyceps javanica]
MAVIQLADGRGIFLEALRSAFRPLCTASTLLAAGNAGGHSCWAGVGELPLRPESALMSIRLQGLAEERRSGRSVRVNFSSGVHRPGGSVNGRTSCALVAERPIKHIGKI